MRIQAVQSEIQTICECLNNLLRCAVKADDYPEMRMFGYAAERCIVDDVWLQAIRHRKVPHEVVKWLSTFDIAGTAVPLRIPANAKLGMLPRICVPIRWGNSLVGHLWIVDREPPLTDQEVQTAVSACDTLASAMFRLHALGRAQMAREAGFLEGLLSLDREARERAAQELLASNFLVRGLPIAILVVRPLPPDDKPRETDIQMMISSALEEAQRTVFVRHGLRLLRPDHGVFLTTVRDPQLRTDGLLRRGKQMYQTALMTADGRAAAWRIVVGVGEPCERIADAFFSYRQAQQAAQIAEMVQSVGDVVSWSQLGVYRILVDFPVENLDFSTLHPGLAKLFAHRDREWLVETLECFLDRAGDVQASAAALFLHRASLYYRLKKIEEIAKVDLSEGADRLALHLGLKLARVAGIHPLQHGSVTDSSLDRETALDDLT